MLSENLNPFIVLPYNSTLTSSDELPNKLNG
jgi:hypothetical protein